MSISSKIIGAGLVALATLSPALAQQGGITLPPITVPQAPALPAAPAPGAPAPVPGAPAQATPAPAPPAYSPSHLAAAADLVAVQRVVEQYSQIGNVMAQQVEQAFTTSNPLFASDERLRTAFREVVAAIETEVAPERNAALAEFAARAYAERFSEAELREAVAFFRSPTGQKFLRAAPLAAQEIIGAVDDMMRRVGPQLVQRIRLELRRRGHQI